MSVCVRLGENVLGHFWLNMVIFDTCYEIAYKVSYVCGDDGPMKV